MNINFGFNIYFFFSGIEDNFYLKGFICQHK